MSIHIPALLKEAVKSLNLKKGAIVVDATLGGGGHTREIIKKIGDEGILVAIDLDLKALDNFAELPIASCQMPNDFQIPIFKFENKYLVNSNFSNLGIILKTLKIGKADAVLADLGWSSDQLLGKGMSFMKDEPLDMRLCRKQELNAEKVVNEYSQEELERIIRKYGEEKFSKNISKKIVERRKSERIKTTRELSEIIKSAIPEKFCHGKINPATRTFQALRIEVNGEIENLKKFIPEAISSLKRKGRLAIISFHSLEDRLVKINFRENAGGCICPNTFPQCRCGRSPKVKIITKKPIIPGEEELKNNPRSRSAKLRICEKI